MISPMKLLAQVLSLVALAPVLVAASAPQETRPESPQVLVIHCGQLLAIPGQEPQAERTIVVKGDRIAAVLPGKVSPKDAAGGAEATLIDLSDSFVLPGLIDCHVHITNTYDKSVRLRQVEESEADAAIKGAAYARKTLLAGFTTVRDLGSMGDAAFAVRDGIAAGLIPGPRILVAGRAITPTGGHADLSLGYRENLFAMPGAMEGVGDGADGCRKAVRAQIKRTADVIKVTATGGVLSNTAAGYEQQLFDDELAAIVTTAHLLGRRVAAHAHGTRGIKAALRAGVDSIEHGTFLDEEAVSLFLQARAFLVPTMMAGETVARHAEIQGYYTAPTAAKARIIGPAIGTAVARAVKGGVRIAFGTDCGVGEHGENAHEFELLVRAGLSPAEAIVAATSSAAELCNLTSEIGTVEPGKAADLVATAKSPIADVSELRRVKFVMRAGVVHKHE
jgi:imidazolonepropionase-like amidohydrolase